MTKTLLLTGANRGIGLELARQYAELGWRVLATCRQPDSAVELNRLTATSGGRVSVHPLDVCDRTQIDALRQSVADIPIDVLFNNAGIYGQDDASFGHLDEEKWLETFRVNTIAPMKLIEAFVDNVARSGHKLIASMSSKMGSMADNGSGGSYAYRSSKAALNAVVASAAIDLRARGIIALVLHPGWVKTDMGGANAEISASESAHKLIRLMESVTIKDSGRFFDIDGTVIPW